MSAKNRNRPPTGAKSSTNESKVVTIGLIVLVGGLIGVGGAAYFARSSATTPADTAVSVHSLPRQSISVADGVVVSARLALETREPDAYEELQQRDAELRDAFTNALMKTRTDTPVAEQIEALRAHMAKVAGPDSRLKGIYVVDYLIDR